MLGEPGRPGFHTVCPYLITPEPEALVDFVTRAFGAAVTLRMIGSAGGAHIEVQLGDSVVMIGGGPGSSSFPAMLHLYVADCDAVYRQALAAGATSVAEPAEHGDGDRRCGVEDQFANQWYIATHIGHSAGGRI